MTVPLQLSTDYVKIEDRNRIAIVKSVKPKHIKRKKRESHCSLDTYKKMQVSKTYFSTMKLSNPVKYRFMRIHGKGDMPTGLAYYNAYFDRLKTESEEITDILKMNRLMAPFSLYIQTERNTLSRYAIRGKDTKHGDWRKMLTLRKIVRGYEPFMESMKMKGL